MSVERWDRVGRLAAISAVWREAFDRTHEAATLAVATGAGRAALAEAGADDPRRGVLLEGLASALQEKYLLTGDTAVLRNSVRLGREAAASGNVDAALVSGNLCGRLMLLFEATQEPGLMDEAVARGRDAVAAVEPGSLSARACSANLRQALFRRYEVFDDVEALAETLETGSRALEEAAEDDPMLPRLRHNHAVALRARYQREGDIASLDESCALLKQAVVGAPGNPMYLMSEAGSLLIHHYASGDTADARAALRSCLAALELTGDGDPRRPAYLNITAAVLGELGKAEADIELTRRAVEYGRACVEATPSDAADRPFHLSNLAGHLSILHSRTGEEELLREAVVLLHKAFDLLPDGHLARAGCLGQMVECLMSLYDHTGEEHLADEAIEAARAAIALTPAQSPFLGSMFNNLSIVLRIKHTLDRSPETLAEAVESARRAVSAPGDEARLPLYLDSLRHCLVRLDQSLGGDEKVRRETVDVSRRMLDLTTENGPGYAKRLASLAWTLLMSSYSPGCEDAAAEAVSLGRKAYRMSSDAATAFTLGCALLRWGGSEPGEAVLEEVTEALAAGAADEGSPPQDRLEAARTLAFARSLAGDPEGALEAMEESVALLPAIAPWRLAQGGRTRMLGRHGGLASEAAGAALDAGREERAVVLLERARVLLLGEALRMRTDLEGLDPALAEEFVRLRESLAQEAEEQPGHLSLLEAAGERRRLARAFDDLVARIQALPDHSGFLSEPGIGDLLAESADGPVVLVTATFWRSDALVLEPGGVRVVPLPDLDLGTAGMWARRLGGNPEPDNALLLGMLGWLWDTVAGPVLAALDPEPGSRLWWCPVGVLASLPLHAAGRYAEADGQSVPGRVVSSYTATVRALGHARSRGTGGGEGALLVAVPEAEGHLPLPGSAREIGKVTGRLRSAGVSVAEETRAAAILEAMPGRPLVHLACHAVVDAGSPWVGGVVLDDPGRPLLTVGEISRLDLSGAGLAYLSACETGGVRFGAADEAVHLAGAFQVAGYPQVIGTLWEVKDRIAECVADGVYKELLEGGSLHTERAPFALHTAVEAVRERFPDAPVLWAAFCHHGR